MTIIKLFKSSLSSFSSGTSPIITELDPGISTYLANLVFGLPLQVIHILDSLYIFASSTAYLFV